VAAVVSLAWASIFAKARRQALDPGWFLAAWLFTALLPAAIPLPFVVIGLSFGLVFGCHVFGGTGRYIVNPALLGTVFLIFSYPEATNSGWVPGLAVPTTWSIAATEGIDALTASGTGWFDVVIGREIAAIGVPAAGACLAGALFLILSRLASWRIVIGSILGIVFVGIWFESLPWQWQPMLGTFAFALAFVVTDPTTMPVSRLGCWMLGLLFGGITIVIRMFNPEHPEGTLFALLLASLLTPLIDHWVASGKAINVEGEHGHL
jgi:Na+-transporting NADH:ubiquinone oxidoreductase subunit B